MKATVLLVLFLGLTGLFSSTGCFKEAENIDDVLLGKWDVVKVNGQYYLLGIRIFDITDNNPSGTIEFRENGTGTQDYTFYINNQSYDNKGLFNWQADDTIIYINRGTTEELQWKRIINQSNTQEATYRIEGNNNDYTDYTLTMSK